MTEIVRAEIVSRRGKANNYVCKGFKASGLPELCRKLIEAGCNPAIRLQAFRGEMFCLTVRSIGEAAELEIAGSGVGFQRVSVPQAAAPCLSASAAQHVGRASLVSDWPRPIGRQPSGQKSHVRARTPRGSAVRP